MRRFHVNVHVKSLEDSTEFYTNLFGRAPDVVKPKYRKWALNEPAINFSLTPGNGKDFGVDHLGFQFEDSSEVDAIESRLTSNNYKVKIEQNIECCYAKSNKVWTEDPQNVLWENFFTMGESDKFGDEECNVDQTCGEETKQSEAAAKQSCCPSS